MDPVSVIFVSMGTAKFLAEMMKSSDLDEQSARTLQCAYNIQASAQAELQEHRDLANESLTKLINRKRAVLQSFIPRFIEMYQVIQDVVVEEGDGIRELYTKELVAQRIDDLKAMALIAAKPLSDREAVVQFLFKGISRSILEDSQRDATAARQQQRAANAVASQVKNYIIVIDTIRTHAEQLAKLLANFNVLFSQSLQSASAVIQKNGVDRNCYSVKEREILLHCVNLAGAIVSILNVPVLDSEGSISKASLIALSEGQKHLEKLRIMGENQ